MSSITRLYFADHGQDFLWWDLDEHDVVVDCGPFQQWLWKDAQVLDYGLGACPEFRAGHSPKVRTLNYPVVALEQREMAA